MTPETLLEISRRDADVTPVLANIDAEYEGTRIPLKGLATVESTRESLHASIVDTEGWNMRMMSSMQAGEMISIGGFFRNIAPGYLLGPNAGGTIMPTGGGWVANKAKYIGEGGNDDPPGDRFRFKIETLTVHGPAVGNPIAATRLLFAGGEWDALALFSGKRLIVRALTDEAQRREDETLSATIDGTLDSLEQHALWVLLNFITGNRLGSLAIEHYDDDGILIETVHRRGAGVSIGRNKPFHYHYGPLTPYGMQLLGNGILRLMRAEHPFPIENIIHHVLDANQGNIDTDAQHLVLGIHAAFEAWNRKYGRADWIGDKAWLKMAKKIRKSIDAETYDVIPEDVRSELKQNIASDMNHSNRTTMGWRQRLLFDALQIDVTDADSKRVLELRNELLHNGYFLKRWRELTREQAQERRDDVERLRRLAWLIIFRLTGYEGDFCSPIRLQPEHVKRVPLPRDITPPPDAEKDAETGPGA